MGDGQGTDILPGRGDAHWYELNRFFYNNLLKCPR